MLVFLLQRRTHGVFRLLRTFCLDVTFRGRRRIKTEGTDKVNDEIVDNDVAQMIIAAITTCSHN